MARTVNDLDMETWSEIIDDKRSNPDRARVMLRSHTEWLGRAKSRTSISTSYGKVFTVDGDEPPSLLGEGLAPKAVEYLLHALGACLVVGIAYNAAARGIDVQHAEIDLEGDIDLQGFLGISSEVRPGYQAMRLKCRVEARASEEEIKDLWTYVQRTSPVLDAMSKGVPISTSLEVKTRDANRSYMA